MAKLKKLMKTRKQKDQKQRLNYAQHEVQHVLASYYTKKISNKTKGVYHPRGNILYITQRSEQVHDTEPSTIIDAIRSAGKTVPAGNFAYPNTLKKLFNEHTQIKSLLLLESYHQARSTTESTGNEDSTRPWQRHGTNLQSGSSCSTGLLYDSDLLKAAYSLRVKCKNSITRIRGRCTQSNRPRSVSRLFRLSRIRSRSLILNGKISGCSRAT